MCVWGGHHPHSVDVLSMLVKVLRVCGGGHYPHSVDILRMLVKVSVCGGCHHPHNVEVLSMLVKVGIHCLIIAVDTMFGRESLCRPVVGHWLSSHFTAFYCKIVE